MDNGTLTSIRSSYIVIKEFLQQDYIENQRSLHVFYGDYKDAYQEYSK